MVINKKKVKRNKGHCGVMGKNTVRDEKFNKYFNSLQKGIFLKLKTHKKIETTRPMLFRRK